MNITAIRSDRMDRNMMDAAPEKEEAMHREEIMKPFEFKWARADILHARSGVERNGIQILKQTEDFWR